MNPRLDAQESYREFRVPMYRDAEGANVIADVDGPGYFAADGPVNCLVASPFEEELVATIPAEATGVVRVGLGRTAPPTGQRFEVDSAYRGCGWVIQSDGPTTIDNGTRRFGSIDPRVPVPFFRRVHCPGALHIVPAIGLETEELARWQVFDPVAIDTLNVAFQNATQVFELTSTWPDDEAHTTCHQSFLNAYSWTQAIPLGCVGLRVERTYDQFHGRQRARVLVDGAFAGWWYDPAENRRHRWNRSEIGISERFVAGRSSVRITLDPPAGVPLWNMSEIRVWAVLESS